MQKAVDAMIVRTGGHRPELERAVILQSAFCILLSAYCILGSGFWGFEDR